MSESSKRAILAMLECAMCLSQYEEKGDLEPRQMSCGHSFCLGCVRSLKNSAMVSRSKPVTCPNCRAVLQFPRNGESNGDGLGVRNMIAIGLIPQLSSLSSENSQKRQRLELHSDQRSHNNSYNINGASQYIINAAFKYEGQVLSGNRDGQGKCTWLSGPFKGDVYEGGWKNDVFEGKGKHVLSTGEVWEGDFKNGRIVGKVLIRFANGSSYNGDWVNEKKEGKGEYRWPDGRVYIGEFKNDKCSGSGEMRDVAGNVTHRGIFENGKYKGVVITTAEYRYEGHILNYKREGRGKCSWTGGSSTGDFYEGDWKSDTMEGKGKLLFKSGDAYEGDFKNGKMDGKGVYRYKDGRRYEGDYVKGLKQGNGIFFWKDGSYNGDWKYDKRKGKGVQKWKNGESYEGDWKSNKRAGRGTFCWASGRAIFDIYQGEWRKNKKEGKGILRFKNGDVYEGHFMNDRQEGKGTFRGSNYTYEGHWKSGLKHGQGLLRGSNGNVMKEEWQEDVIVGLKRKISNILENCLDEQGLHIIDIINKVAELYRKDGIAFNASVV